MRILASGTVGLTLECDTLSEVLATYASVRAANIAGVIDIVPAARTVLVSIDPSVISAESLRRHLNELDRANSHGDLTFTASDVSAGVEIPVVYDGADLEDVAAHRDCSTDDLIQHHTSTRWTVAFCGFAPGFGYLIADGGGWSTPRRESPRTAVPAGSVALAGEFAGVYPRESPGGWQIIGRTAATIFDLALDPPALLMPGTRVQFTAVDA